MLWIFAPGKPLAGLYRTLAVIGCAGMHLESMVWCARYERAKGTGFDLGGGFEWIIPLETLLVGIAEAVIRAAMGKREEGGRGGGGGCKSPGDPDAAEAGRERGGGRAGRAGGAAAAALMAGAAALALFPGLACHMFLRAEEFYLHAPALELSQLNAAQFTGIPLYARTFTDGYASWTWMPYLALILAALGLAALILRRCGRTPRRAEAGAAVTVAVLYVLSLAVYCAASCLMGNLPQVWKFATWSALPLSRVMTRLLFRAVDRAGAGAALRVPAAAEGRGSGGEGGAAGGAAGAPQAGIPAGQGLEPGPGDPPGGQGSAGEPAPGRVAPPAGSGAKAGFRNLAARAPAGLLALAAATAFAIQIWPPETLPGRAYGIAHEQGFADAAMRVLDDLGWEYALGIDMRDTNRFLEAVNLASARSSAIEPFRSAGGALTRKRWLRYSQSPPLFVTRDAGSVFGRADFVLTDIDWPGLAGGTLPEEKGRLLLESRGRMEDRGWVTFTGLSPMGRETMGRHVLARIRFPQAAREAQGAVFHARLADSPENSAACAGGGTLALKLSAGSIKREHDVALDAIRVVLGREMLAYPEMTAYMILPERYGGGVPGGPWECSMVLESVEIFALTPDQSDAE
jgi:hypothetical protein